MSGVRQALEKLRGVRHIEWALIAAALAAMLLLMGDTQEEADLSGASLERRMEAVLSSVQGAGRVRVLVNQATAAFSESDASVTGVLVVAEGAEDMRVSIALQQAVQALLGVDAEQIEILVMEEEP